jgi:hypothetical protein
MTSAAPGAEIQLPKVRQRQSISGRRMDKSGQGPKRAVAEDVDRPLGIQPRIVNQCRILLKIGQMLRYCSFNSYACHSVLQ